MPQLTKEHPEYRLTNGLYASFVDNQIKLKAHQTFRLDQVIYLSEEDFEALLRYAKGLWKEPE